LGLDDWSRVSQPPCIDSDSVGVSILSFPLPSIVAPAHKLRIANADLLIENVRLQVGARSDRVQLEICSTCALHWRDLRRM
jgi:hypothetical protein